MEPPLKLIIEALLFTSSKPLTIREIQEALTDVSTGEIEMALLELHQDYETLARSFILKEVAEGYQIRTRPRFGPYIGRMLKNLPTRLSRAALETLAIIAYKQPVIRQEIETFRGVDTGGILKTLLEKGLIRIMGRKDLPGRPLIYGTTKKFLEVFDLKDLESLPRLKEIEGLGAEHEEIREQADGGEEETLSEEQNQEASFLPEEATETDHGQEEACSSPRREEEFSSPEDSGASASPSDNGPSSGIPEAEPHSVLGGTDIETPGRPMD